MERDDDPTVTRLAPDEAFGLLGDETRFEILRVLNRAEESLSFSELRTRVGADDPGGFNYHLGKLAGQFVRKTEDGYDVSPPGARVVGAVLSGGYTAEFSADPVPVDGNCLHCGGRLEAVFREHGITIDCTGCEWMFTDPEIPAGLMDGMDAAAAPTVVARWLRTLDEAAEVGMCANCHGQLDSTLYLSDDEDAPDWLDGSGLVGMEFHECGRCGHRYNRSVQLAVLSHPLVAAFHYEHGIDLRETPRWELPWLKEDNATVESTDPLRIAVPMTLGGETRTFVFDRELDVVERHDGDEMTTAE